MPQSLLDKMDYNQLKSLATSRGITLSEPHNSEALRKAIHDWEIDRGLPFKGLKEIVTKNTEATDLSAIEGHLLDLKQTLGELLSRVAHIETVLKGQDDA